MFWLTPEVDDGDIIGIEAYDITSDDTVRSVYYKTSMAMARLIQRFLPLLLKGSAPRMKQLGESFHYPKRSFDDGRIDWRNSTDGICSLVRAVTRPYPGAFTTRGGKNLIVWMASDFGNSLLVDHAEPGEVVFVSLHSPPEIAVRTGSGSVLITDYEFDGSAPILGEILGA
jgi:methionyl-tRNA formyltransferase